MVEHLRERWRRVMTPPARLLLRRGVSPDVVTWVGTVGACLVALLFFPRGLLWQGALTICLFIFSDSLDGTMARLAGRPSRWGSFFDATLDRISDGVIFGSLVLYYAGPGDWLPGVALGVGVLITGQVTSYAKARGEAEGFTVQGGLAGRADRLLVVLVGALLTGLGLRPALPVALGYLVLAGALTIAQRIGQVRRQALAGQHQGSTRPDQEESNG